MLTLYRILMTLALPVLVLMTLWQQARGHGPAGTLCERLGLCPHPPGGPSIWMHGASLGELASARWVLQGLLIRKPDLSVLVTANTASGRAMVAGWALPGVTAAMAPFDALGAPGRVLRAWRPAALVVIEGELWPARLATARSAGVPVLVLGARLSARSAARWARLPGLVAPMLQGLTWVSAQDSATRDRLAALGLPGAAQGPDLDLKARAAAPRTRPPPGPVPRHQVLLAASTHDGEEAAILQAFAAQRTFTHLILAPRHPIRGDQIAALIAATGQAFTRRSAGQDFDPDHRVLLADTLGEMDRWYALAGTCLIGGTLVPKGGHTPYEPGLHGCALLHGASTENFAQVFARLDAAGGALSITADSLAATLDCLSLATQDDLAAHAAPILRPAEDGGWIINEILTRARL